MPKDSPVHKMYEALKREGYSKERAAKIAQAQTGLSLATGEPPKHENEKPEETESYKNGYQNAITEIDGVLNGCRK